MVRTRRESHHCNGITDPKRLQPSFATKSAKGGLVHRSTRSFRWRLQAAPARRSGQALSRFSDLCPIQTWSASPQGLGRRGKSRQLEKEIVISGTGRPTLCRGQTGAARSRFWSGSDIVRASTLRPLCPSQRTPIARCVVLATITRKCSRRL